MGLLSFVARLEGFAIKLVSSVVKLVSFVAGLEGFAMKLDSPIIKLTSFVAGLEGFVMKLDGPIIKLNSPNAKINIMHKKIPVANSSNWDSIIE